VPVHLSPNKGIHNVKHLILALSALGLLIAVRADEAKGPDKKASYIIGHNIGNSVSGGLKRDNAPVDLDELQRGFKDGLAGKELGMDQQEVGKIMNAFSQRIRDAKAKGSKAFLDTFAKEEGVKKTDSGLLYKVLAEGKGKSPKATDTVKVNYRGTLTDGKEFDSSYKRGKPAEFEVGKLIPGWTEALQMMKPGSKWKLVIPGNLAYGERGAPPMIGPNETLVFEMELLSIVK
jgi:FKBP-type peptidyl-prolyl cis-trans isomerase FklB